VQRVVPPPPCVAQRRVVLVPPDAVWQPSLSAKPPRLGSSRFGSTADPRGQNRN
jgi:hypothetical protein